MDGSGLILMDLQVGVCGQSEECKRRGIFPLVARALEAARTAKIPVIHVRVAFDEHYTLRTSRSPRFEALRAKELLKLGTPAVEFVPEAKPLPGEPVVTKGCVNPFIGTPLTELLIGHRIGELYLAGFATNYVVESAARHAADTGFGVHIIEDACASFDAESHDFAMKILAGYGTICKVEDFVTYASSKAQ